jgi:broad specificity phosphatase PhoE
MTAIMYLIRHAATDANLARPARLQGRRHDPPLAKLGIRQAEMTRDFLAVRPIDQCYCSPMARAVETAGIIAAPYGLTPQALDDLTECDVGEWEGLDWQTISRKFPEQYRRFMANPAEFGYPGGESFADVQERGARSLEHLWQRHQGESMIVVAHHVINRTYLAGLLGLAPAQARQVSLDNCGISVVKRDAEKTVVSTLNAAFHLQGIAA